MEWIGWIPNEARRVKIVPEVGKILIISPIVSWTERSEIDRCVDCMQTYRARQHIKTRPSAHQKFMLFYWKKKFYVERARQHIKNARQHIQNARQHILTLSPKLPSSMLSKNTNDTNSASADDNRLEEVIKEAVKNATDVALQEMKTFTTNLVRE